MKFGNGWSERKLKLGTELLRLLYEQRILRTWLRDQETGWELVSGLWSPLYFAMRDVPSRPKLFQQCVRAGVELIRHEVGSPDHLIGVASTGIPLAAAMAYEGEFPMGFTRKLPGVRRLADLEAYVDEYGGHGLVEAEFRTGTRLVVFDDVVSKFDSKAVAIGQIDAEVQRRGIQDVSVSHVVVLVDRGAQTPDLARQHGIELVSLLVLAEEGIQMLRGIASDRELEVIQDYILCPENYQDSDVKARLRDEALATRREKAR